MFEAEAETFRRAGIQIGANIGDAEENLMREALAPFGVARRNSALEMARLYAVLFCFENEIRDFIREALEEKEGLDWQDKLPPRLRSTQRAEEKRRTKIRGSRAKRRTYSVSSTLVSLLRSSSRSGSILKTSSPASIG
jgi:cell division septum initiation protein DivIVA